MKKILVVAHDAGEANILSSLIKKYRKDFNWISCLAGPAKDIFLRKKIDLYTDLVDVKNNNVDNLVKSLRPDLILTGTGKGSDSKIDFIRAGQKNNIKTASFLDHWCNYKERFGYPGKWRVNLPDLILVGDKWAYKVALKNGFPQKTLIQVENPYFEEIIKEAKRIKKKRIKRKRDNKIKILYVSEPIYIHALKEYNDPYYWGYTEYEVLKDLFKIIKLVQTNLLLELKVRLHPAERTNKYSKLLKNKKYQGIRKFILISKPAVNSLLNDCIKADVVIGSATMALVVALLIGKKAISYIPANKQVCPLPQKEIKKIKSGKKLLKEIKKFKKNEN